jgi:hypothetical protein
MLLEEILSEESKETNAGKNKSKSISVSHKVTI